MCSCPTSIYIVRTIYQKSIDIRLDLPVFCPYNQDMGKTRGRPTKPPDDVLSERVEIRLSVADREAFEQAADAVGLKLSDWIRRKLHAECRRSTIK